MITHFKFRQETKKSNFNTHETLLTINIIETNEGSMQIIKNTTQVNLTNKITLCTIKIYVLITYLHE